MLVIYENEYFNIGQFGNDLFLLSVCCNSLLTESKSDHCFKCALCDKKYSGTTNEKYKLHYSFDYHARPQDFKGDGYIMNWLHFFTGTKPRLEIKNALPK